MFELSFSIITYAEDLSSETQAGYSVVRGERETQVSEPVSALLPVSMHTTDTNKKTESVRQNYGFNLLDPNLNKGKRTNERKRSSKS